MGGYILSNGHKATHLAPGRRCVAVAVGCFGAMYSEEAFAVPALGASLSCRQRCHVHKRQAYASSRQLYRSSFAPLMFDQEPPRIDCCLSSKIISKHAPGTGLSKF